MLKTWISLPYTHMYFKCILKYMHVHLNIAPLQWYVPYSHKCWWSLHLVVQTEKLDGLKFDSIQMFKYIEYIWWINFGHVETNRQTPTLIPPQLFQLHGIYCLCTNTTLTTGNLNLGRGSLSEFQSECTCNGFPMHFLFWRVSNTYY